MAALLIDWEFMSSFDQLVTWAKKGAPSFAAVSRVEGAQAARAYLVAAQEEIRARHLAGESGGNVLRQLTEVADTVVKGLATMAVAQTASGVRLLDKITVCALGGYGRRELSPCSDLDVCLLYERKLDQEIRMCNDYLLPCLWDTGFRVGYAIYSVAEAIDLARTDPQMFTSYSQARPIVGNAGIYERLRAQLAQLRPKEISAVMRHVRQREHPSELPDAYRELYAAEPDIKENVGGLRDFHAAQWMILLHRGAVSFDDLVAQQQLDHDELLDAMEGLDFIWRVRNQLHFHTKKPDNKLTFAMQAHVAEAFGYGGKSSTELDRFMQDYYNAARRTRRFLQIAVRVCDAGAEEVVEDVAPGKAVFDAQQGPLRVLTTDPNWFAEHPPRLMQVFWECARRNAPLSHGLEALVRKNLHLVNDAFRSNDLVRRFFVGLCSRPTQAGYALRQMAHAGVLGAYLPEFGAVQGIVRYEDFHSYPVDEHTLRAVEALASVPQREGPVARVLERTLEHVRDPHVLVLAVLFHDLGKVLGEEHVEEGVRLTHEAGARIGLSAEDIERIAFLVKHHMVMNQISMYRDTDDPDVVQAFADIMENENRLRALFLISFADLAAVGPEVWNDWKGTLLLKLFLRTERALASQGKPPERVDFWELPKALELMERVPEPYKLQVETHVLTMGERYLGAFSGDHILLHINCLEEARIKGLAIRCVAHDDTGMSEIVVCTRDQHGLFAQIAGSLASQLVDVHDAALFTSPDGYVVDCFTVRDAANKRPLSDTQVKGVERVLHAVLANDQDVQKYVDQSRKRLFALVKPKSPVRTQIRFDNDASKIDTVIDIETGDRTGLLYDMAQALARMGVDVVTARIVTDERRVRDSFYVRMNDQKVENEGSLGAIRDGLEQAIGSMAKAAGKGE